jgi:hypothetical protein
MTLLARYNIDDLMKRNDNELENVLNFPFASDTVRSY